MSVFAAILAEVAFRGIMQTRVQAVLRRGVGGPVTILPREIAIVRALQ